MAAREFDVIVIGAGSTGENVADRVVKGGLSAIVVEAELVGGECSYRACTPSKALLRPGQALDEAKSVNGSCQAISGKLDIQAVLARRDQFVNNWNDSGQVKWLNQSKIELARGHGRLTGERQVSVTDNSGTTTNLTARHAVVICTGSRPAIPNIPGLAEIHPWTSREATSANKAPQRLAILGGGVVACEMATAWSQLGSENVTVIERGSRLIKNYEPFAGDLLKTAFEKQGITVLTDTTAQKAEHDETGSVSLSLSNGQKIVADQVLVGAGRRPRTDDIGLEIAGLTAGSWIDVDDSMRVKGVRGNWLYAAGDVNHRALLTHMGKYQARVCGDIIAARATGKLDAHSAEPWSQYSATADNCAVPQVIFTNPEVAAVGLTVAQAKARGITVRTVEYEIGEVAGASLYTDGYTGRAQMVIDQTLGVLLGMTLVGPAVGELIHAATIAIVAAVPISRLWHAVPAFPTISEVWLKLFQKYGM